MRLRNLGELGFWGDEDITALAVKGILEHGYPQFPTGAIYLRSAPFHYLLALSATLFGFNEFALRLPAVLFGTATIPLAYLFAGRLFGKSVGLIVAAVVSVSFWELEMSRYARMYAPFAFFYLLTAYAFYYYYVDGNGKRRTITAFLSIFTITVHLLGFTLALFFFFPLLFRDYRTASRGHLFLNFAAISTFFLVWDRMLVHLFYLPLEIDPTPIVRVGHQQVSEPSALGGLLRIVTNILGRFQAPSFELLENVYQSAFPIFIVLLLVGLALAAFYLMRAIKVGGADHWLFLFITVSCLLHQFNFAMIFFFAYLFLQNEGLFALHDRHVRGLAAAIAVVFAFYLSCGFFLVEPNEAVLSGKSTHLRQTIKALIDYPQFFIVWGFIDERPVMSFVAALGFLWCFHVSAQKKGRQSALFLILAFFSPLVVAGLFSSQREPFRYNFHLDGLYFTFFALGLAKWHVISEPLLASQRNVRRSLASLRHSLPIRIAVSGLFLIAALSTDLNPVKSWVSTERMSHDPGILFEQFGLKPYKDFKTTGTYVKTQLKHDDIVMVLDSRELYNYLEKIDYWIVSAGYEEQIYLQNREPRDMYVGTPVVSSLQALQQIIDESNGRRVWIVGRERKARVSRDIAGFIDGLSRNVVYVGTDRRSNVYLLDKHSKDYQ